MSWGPATVFVHQKLRYIADASEVRMLVTCGGVLRPEARGAMSPFFSTLRPRRIV